MRLAIIAAALAALAAAPASASEAAKVSSAVEFAQRVQVRTEHTSFAALRAFGDAATAKGDLESLRRLQHVVTIFRGQQDFQAVHAYNGELRTLAQRLGNRRYLRMADLNDLVALYDGGDQSPISGFQAALQDPDPYVRTFAASWRARAMVDHGETGDALRLLGWAESQTPTEDQDYRAAESYVWVSVGIALIHLNDFEGAAEAFERGQFEYAQPGYPYPDFDAVYNLAHMAIRLGDRAAAEKLVAIDRDLTVRAGLTDLTAWDANLCAMNAEAFGSPRQVLDCLKGVDPDLKGFEFMSSSRAIAEARLGRLAEAHVDLERLRRFTKQSQQNLKFARLREVEAEVRKAEGDPAGAYDLLRAQEKMERFLTAQETYAGVRQITGSLEARLSAARRQSEDQARAVRTQQVIIALGASLLIVGGGLLLLQLATSRRLRAAQARAEDANAAKSAFLATISHEIRTPLNGVLGMAQAMSGGAMTAEQRERLGVIRESGESLLAILNDVLDLSKIEAGKIELDEAEFELGEVARGAYAAFTAIANKKGLSFGLDMEPASGRYRGDPVRLRQILYNLISNALKFTEKGEIRVGAAYRDGRLVVAVSDTGMGIARENFGKLFEKFDQLDASTTRRFGGSGLGLSICRELARLMGGDISVESEVGHGSTFTLTIPLERLGAEATEDLASADPESLQQLSLRVLAAEDNTINQLVLKTLLHQFGVTPHVVDNGRAAIEAWEGGDWDVVLMDVQMPVMDGLSAAAAIRALELARGRPRTRILALTANAMAHQVKEYLDAGMDGHLAKPIEIAALYQALREAQAARQAPAKARPRRKTARA
jgi:signal transduction histidine kinase/AmiR/NasT family two-component response regulator